MARSGVQHKQTRPKRAGLADWRREQGRSQVFVAEKLGWTQSEVSRFERRRDVHVSTLVRYVAAVGARLELYARSSDGTYAVLELVTSSTRKAE